MPSINVSDDEARVLHEVLNTYHDSLLGEISHTDSLEFKEILRARETVISNVLEQLDEIDPGMQRERGFAGRRDARTAGRRASRAAGEPDTQGGPAVH